jgi:hypothetical protein
MKRIGLVILALTFGACGGPSYGSTGIRTPDEYVEEQERLAEQQAQQEAQQPREGGDEETDLEKRRKFDERQSELELKRAARSAETCPGSLTADQQKAVQPGTAKVTLLFGNNGRVKQATLAPPYEGTPVGNCVLRAMGNVIVPAFDGPEHTVHWDIEISPK